MKVVLGHHAKHQVVFVGPFGVGKTTALRAVSDIPVASMETASLEAAALGDRGKTTTTVGFDYGEWQFPDGARVGLYGVPGQERFNAMWDALLPQSSAVVLWLYGDRGDALADGRFWLDALARRKAVARLAVAVTRLAPDTPDEQLEPYRRLTSRYHALAPVITADPRDAGSVMQAIMVALSTPFSAVQA
jgi:signal recognition particle receptor subunit beta